MRGFPERLLLAGYGVVSALVYGLLTNFWFWPFVGGTTTTYSFVPGLGTLANLHRFILFDLTTSMGFDLTRAVTCAVMVLVLGRPVLAALRRASRRAAFEPQVDFTDVRLPGERTMMRAVKIVSLLPSATEIVFALDLGAHLRGVSFECDYPEPARSVPIVSGTALPTDGSLSAQEIDAAVSARVAAGESIYTLDDARIREIDPDLILAQDLCQVCAVPSGAVEEALEVIGCHAQVVSLDPGRLDEVIDCIGVVGAATGTGARADALMKGLRAPGRRGTTTRHGTRAASGAGPGVA